MKTVDCRGLHCPEPVIRTKKALESNVSSGLKIIVDNDTAKENVLRFLRNQGLSPSFHDEQGLFYISTESREVRCADVVEEETDRVERVVLLLTTDQLGQGSIELGQLLMRNFIYTLTENTDKPQTIIMINSGVKLATNGSPVSDELKELADAGVEIFVCGTCLDYYSLKESHNNGLVSNMYDITEALIGASKVITI